MRRTHRPTFVRRCSRSFTEVFPESGTGNVKGKVKAIEFVVQSLHYDYLQALIARVFGLAFTRLTESRLRLGLWFKWDLFKVTRAVTDPKLLAHLPSDMQVSKLFYGYSRKFPKNEIHSNACSNAILP